MTSSAGFNARVLTDSVVCVENCTNGIVASFSWLNIELVTHFLFLLHQSLEFLPRNAL